VLTDDGLGVAGLKGGIADGAEGTDCHGNVGMAKDVVTEGEFLPNFAQDAVDVARWDLRIFFDRVFLQPELEVWLDLEGALFVDLRHIGLDANDAVDQINVFDRQLTNIAMLPVGANAAKERESEERDKEARRLRAFGAAI